MITDAQLQHFHEEGYLLVPGLFDPAADLDPIIEEYKGVLGRLAQQLYDEGKVEDTYDALPFGQRLMRLYRESGVDYGQHFDFSLPQGGIKPDTPIWVGPAVFHMLRHPRLLDVIESFIGPEIYSNPVQHVRIKPPRKMLSDDVTSGLINNTPWHQDNGVLLATADETEAITVWFPLLDAPIEKGCLQVIPRSHRDGILTHCPGNVGGLAIPEATLPRERAIPVPMQRGDALFVHRRTAHASLPNLSDDVRWSFDLRYNPIGQPTGRDAFPGFVARSRKNSDLELRDPEQWAQLWYDTRARLADDPLVGPFNRWDGSEMVCA